MAGKYSLFRGRTYLGDETEVGNKEHVTVIASADNNVGGMVIVSRDSQGFRFRIDPRNAHEKLVQYFVDRGTWVTEELLQPGECIRLEENEGDLITYHTIGEGQSESGARHLQIERQVARVRKCELNQCAER